MVIYLDVLIVVNVYITYFVLKASAGLLRFRLRTGRLIAASVLGGVSSATAALMLPFFASMALKAVLTLILTLAAFGFYGVKPFLLRSFTVLTIGMLVCGAALLIREWTGSSVVTETGGYVYLDVSVLTLVGASTAAYVLVSLFRRVLDKPSANERLRLRVQGNGRSVTLTAFPDSGNTLRDFLTGLPVIVCRRQAVLAVAPEGIEAAQTDPPSGVRLIPYSTIDSSGCIAAFRAEHIVVMNGERSGKPIDALIGVGERMDGDFDAVIDPKLLL